MKSGLVCYFCLLLSPDEVGIAVAAETTIILPITTHTLTTPLATMTTDRHPGPMARALPGTCF